MKMPRGLRSVVGVVLAVVLLALFGFLLSVGSLPVLDPKGTIASSQRDLIVVVTLLMLIIVLPVFALTFGIAWRYRESNTKATYSPQLHGSKFAETLWWGLPLLIITVLSVIIWRSSNELDPRRPIVSSVKPLEIQVVALQWKWLFLYPEQNIATINYLRVPTNTPINLTLTADAPMNSFWIPQLGGQIYAMAGMSTKLHLMATENGTYKGSSANLSGEGFSGMRFDVDAVDDESYDRWVRATKADTGDLTRQRYDTLAEPSSNQPKALYGSYTPDLYDTIVMKYMSQGSVERGKTYER